MANNDKRSNREHSFDRFLAEEVGIEKAILLKNIDHWCEENQNKGLKSQYTNGIWWTSESLTNLSRKYKYMKRGNLSRWLNQLREDKWILMYVGEKGNNFYAPGPVFIAWDSGKDWRQVFQNETGRCFKMKQAGVSKRNSVVFQNEIAEKEHNIENDIEGRDIGRKQSKFSKMKKEMQGGITISSDGISPTLMQMSGEWPQPIITTRSAPPSTGISTVSALEAFNTWAAPKHLSPELYPDGRDFEEPDQTILPSQSTKADTAEELQACMREFYKQNPTYWSDGILKFGEGQRFSDEKRQEMVKDFCVFQLKRGQGRISYSQQHAAMQEWFRREKFMTWKQPAQAEPKRKMYGE